MKDRSHEVTTTHRLRWGPHEELVQTWSKRPPVHPVNPRYKGKAVEVEGRYSLFETVINVLRRKGWLDAPPADFKYAIVTVYYEAPEDVMDQFALLDSDGRRTDELPAFGM